MLRWRLSHASMKVAASARRLSTLAPLQPPSLQVVRSATSPIFKRLLALHKQPMDSLPPASLLAEGRTLIQYLASSPWQLVSLILTRRTLDRELEGQRRGEPHLLQLLSPLSTERIPQLLQLSPPLLHRLCHTTTPSEYVAEFAVPAVDTVATADLHAATIVLDGVSDPTNMAALMRSAHAFGFHRLVFRHGSCSPYSHKVVAGSAGSIAYVDVRWWDAREETELRTNRALHRVYVVGLVASAGQPLRDVAERVKRRKAEGAAVWLVVGNESRGLSEDMAGMCDELCTIPMSSEVESLNAAVAASIACYELGQPSVR